MTAISAPLKKLQLTGYCIEILNLSKFVVLRGIDNFIIKKLSCLNRFPNNSKYNNHEIDSISKHCGKNEDVGDQVFCLFQSVIYPT